MNVFTRFLCRCGGYRLDAVALAPMAAGRAAAQGALMLIVASLEFLSWSYGASRLFISSPHVYWIAALVGAIGFAFVFCLDYLMATGLRKVGSWLNTGAQVVIRLLVGVAIAWVTAEPLLLRMNETTLRDFIRADSRRKMLAEQAENDTLAGVPVAQQEAAAVRQAAAAAAARLKGTPDSAEWANAKASYEAAQRQETVVANTNQPRIDRAYQELRRLDGSELPDVARRHAAQNSIITTARRNIADAKAATGEAKRRFDRATDEWYTGAKEDVARANAALEASVGRLDRANADATTRTQVSEASLAALAIPDLINLYTAKVQLEESPTYPAARGLRFWDWGIHVLMVMFECSVVLMKLLSPDDALSQAQAALDEVDAENSKRAADRLLDAARAEAELATERCHLETNAKMAALQQKHQEFERVNHVAQPTIEQERIDRARTNAAEAIAVLKEIRDEMA